MKSRRKHIILLMILSLITALFSGCSLNVMEMMSGNSGELADTYVEWDSGSNQEQKVIQAGNEDIWAFDEEAFKARSSGWGSDVFTTDEIIKDKITFAVEDNRITIRKYPDVSQYDNIFVSLYNQDTGEQGLKKKTYRRKESIEYNVDIDAIAEGTYFLEFYHAGSGSRSYSSSIYSNHGIRLVIEDGRLMFVTPPTPEQITEMSVKYGDEDNLFEYMTKDGRKMCVYVHGKMTYVYSKSEHSTLGVDYVRCQNESNTMLVEEDNTGVVSYDTSELKDGLYYICIYEHNGSKDSDQNYSSIVYEEELLKVRIIDGYAAFLLPPDMESVARQASSVGDRSLVINTSKNEAYDIGLYITGTRICIFRLPETYGFLQINLCNADNQVVGKNVYSCTQRTAYYDTEGLQDGDYFLQLYRYDNENMYISDIAGCLSPKINITDGKPGFEEPSPYKINMSMFNPDAKVKDEYLKEEQNIECNDAYLARVAKDATADCTDDYSKVLAIHDWIAEHIYYDNTLAASDDVIYRTHKASAKVVLDEQTGVCAGIANLMAAMLRSLGIPARKINGYALESEDMHWEDGLYEDADSNHSWNEVYVDDHWILVDTTWDMDNTIEDGEVTSSAGLHNHGFFDCTVEYFSMSHSYINAK